ncbi:sigma-70 family RNA polymerase sigma factor [Sinirhodobacter sp. WL0062]|uniref:Sigma-70 family RNA polymerase sigma factor n=1 Tax=Rhodobacter flavimaris TaxID=2907145 RepID=A0ABS8YVH1_9RHOB|nr:sigma-70 family RNA polymerase sigma factor [Sinirhodobacter sp. WL0062]
MIVKVFCPDVTRACNNRVAVNEWTGTMSDTEELWSGMMRAANRGDAQAYARLLHAISPVLRGVVRARGRTLPPDQHEDIVQEVLMAIHAKRHTWREDQPIRPWLFAITRYKVADAFRRRGVAATPIEDVAERLADEGAGAAIEEMEAAQEIEHLLSVLDARSAEIVRALKLREEAPAQVAKGMGMSEGALRVRLHRALKKLEGFRRRNLS